MAAVLIHSYSPGPRQGILLNSSPAASPAYHPATLPALVPSNSSLSSSASSSAPGEASDYFATSKSASPSPGPSHGSPAPRHAPLPSNPKPRNSSNPGTMRRIRFAPLPEPRRDDDEDMAYPPVFVDDDDASHPSEQHLTMSKALAAASLPLAAHADSDLVKRSQGFPPSIPSSPSATRRSLPSELLPLDPSLSQSSSDSSEPGPETPHLTVPSENGQEWDMVPTSLPALGLNLSTPESPRKTNKWSRMFKPLLGRSGSGKSPLARTFSREEAASINGEAHRGRSTTSLIGFAGSRNSSASREASLSRDQRASDFGAPLDRWTSEGGFGGALPISKKKKLSLFGGSSSNGGVPLGRTQSLTSLSSKDDKKAARGRPTTAPNGRKQQRMLNGRVYGAKRNANANANPFANVRCVALTSIMIPSPTYVYLVLFLNSCLNHLSGVAVC